LERLGSESALENEIPPEINVITRRVLLDRLSAFGLRESLEPWMLDLLLAPDGHWTVEQKQRALPAWECLAVLRWALGLEELRALTADPKYNIEDARTVFAVKQAENLLAVPPWDLRIARDQANNFFQRCWVELLARGAVKEADPESVEMASKARTEIQQAGYTGDFLIGSLTIAELPSPFLWQITGRAFNRRALLALLVEVAAGEVPVMNLRLFFARFFAPSSEMKAVKESA
jgi:hypothetical protein